MKRNRNFRAFAQQRTRQQRIMAQHAVEGSRVAAEQTFRQRQRAASRQQGSVAGCLPLSRKG